MAIRIMDGSKPWAPEVREGMSQLLYTFEDCVRMESDGEATFLLDDSMVSNDDEADTIFFIMGKSSDPFGWEDERDKSFDTNVMITICRWHTVDSSVDLFRPDEDEPFATFPLRMDTFAGDLARAVPGLFPKQAKRPKTREIN